MLGSLAFTFVPLLALVLEAPCCSYSPVSPVAVAPPPLCIAVPAGRCARAACLYRGYVYNMRINMMLDHSGLASCGPLRSCWGLQSKSVNRTSFKFDPRGILYIFL